jgi:hypothetical protein
MVSEEGQREEARRAAMGITAGQAMPGTGADVLLARWRDGPA